MEQDRKRPSRRAVAQVLEYESAFIEDTPLVKKKEIVLHIPRLARDLSAESPLEIMSSTLSDAPTPINVICATCR